MSTSQQSTFFKATRPDGTDFHSGRIDYAGALASGSPVKLPPSKDPQCCSGSVLHAATVPTETLVGGSWPCRLFEVTGEPVAEEGHKRGFFELTVVREVDARQALGPHADAVIALIDQASKLTHQQALDLKTAWDAAIFAARAATGVAAWDAAGAADRDAAWDAAGAAAWDAAGAADPAAAWVARAAAGHAAWAAVVRDLITDEQYRLLAGPWEQAMGPLPYPTPATKTTDGGDKA